jgi:uncharacterized protein
LLQPPHNLAASRPCASTRRTALITGASSGIGEAFANEFAARGFDVVLTARREDRQQAIAGRIAHKYGVRAHVVPCDLAGPGAVSALCDELHRRALSIDALVNGAGFGTSGKFATAEWEVCADMMQVMVTAPVALTHQLLPGMIERRCGWIVNVASVAGLVPSGSGTLYEAAKSFIVRMSTSLAREVSSQGVRVTVVCPGPTRTEFHSSAGVEHTVRGIPDWMWMEPDAVAREAFAGLMMGKPLVISGRRNRLFVLLLRCVPRSMLARAGRWVIQPARRG